MEAIKEHIKKLRQFKRTKTKSKTNLLILEPRIFRIILNELKPKKILELNRVSNSCEQICNQLGVEYKGQHNHKFSNNSPHIKIPDWDGDFICGYTEKSIALSTVLSTLEKLKPGQFFAIWQRYDFLETIKRYNLIFRDNPFDEVILMINRPCVSSDGYFEDFNTRCPYNGGWFIWYGETNHKKKTPIIKWATEEFMQEYYLHDELGQQVVSNYIEGGHKTFKHPVNIEVDLGK